MKILIASILLESNTFCPEKTPLDYFTILMGEEVLIQMRGTTGSFIAGVINTADKLNIGLIPTLTANANPFGPITKDAYDFFVDKIIETVNQNKMEIDGIVLCLHGGMSAEHVFDPEGELVQEIRGLVGINIPIACTLDMHANLSDKFVENTDLIFGNNENPHLDSYERGVEVVEALVKILEGKIKPKKVMKKPGILPPTLLMTPPKSGPLVEVFERIFELEKSPQVININLAVSFPWADTPNAGMSVIAITNDDEILAEEIASELTQMLWEKREEFIPSLPGVKEAIKQALESKEELVVLLDVADNPGDGTTQDSTEILYELLNEKAKNVALAVIRDPEAVEKCIEAGVNSMISLNLGGKDPATTGNPVKVSGKIKNISDGRFTIKGPLYHGGTLSSGKTVVLDVDGIEIIVSERTCNPVDPEIFRKNGIDPTQKKILVVKTFKMHCEPNYSFAKQFIEVDALGQATINLGKLTWKNIPRPMFPIDKQY